MKKLIFTGAATAIVTPMNIDFSVNYSKLKELTENQIENSIDALVVCGTTGESSTLSTEEHFKVIKTVVDTTNGRVPVIAGAGSNNTAHSIELCKNAEKAGADAFLLVTPYYNKASQDGLIAHYNHIADNVNLPIIIYNVPSRTGVNIKPATYKALSKHPNIVAVKEANPDVSALCESISLCGDDLTFYSGNDDTIVPFMSLGCKGVISVLSNVLPYETHKMCADYLNGDINTASDAQIKYIGLIKALFCDVNPIPVKEAMNILGMDVGPVRLPLCPTNAQNITFIKKELSKL